MNATTNYKDKGNMLFKPFLKIVLYLIEKYINVLNLSKQYK